MMWDVGGSTLSLNTWTKHPSPHPFSLPLFCPITQLYPVSQQVPNFINSQTSFEQGNQLESFTDLFPWLYCKEGISFSKSTWLLLLDVWGSVWAGTNLLLGNSDAGFPMNPQVSKDSVSPTVTITIQLALDTMDRDFPPQHTRQAIS